MTRRISALLAILGPGLLMAATGVGAGDLATGAFAGSQLGTTVLWAVLLGGVFKFVLTEGLARWQMATQTTFIQGAVDHLGKAVAWLFLPYLILWSFFVGAALIGACGVALHAMFPILPSAVTGKIVWGSAASIAGLALVRRGSFRAFERAMAVLIGLMFAAVLVTAGALWPGWSAVITGIFRPQIPGVSGSGLTWTIALIGGVGGTVTILCYGYWIQERARSGAEGLRICRIDLVAGYAMTALFGMAMVIIGSSISLEGGGADLLIRLSETLKTEVGLLVSWVFLIGAFCALFSSLLGVWQAVPYLFADVWERLAGRPALELRLSFAYRRYQIALALTPLLGLLVSFRQAQLLYATVGAAFLPLLALGLLVLNGRRSLVRSFRSGWMTQLTLLATMAFFVWAAASRL